MHRWLSSRRRIAALAFLAAAWAAASPPATAQRLSIDHGVRAAGLWCFPLADHPKQWLYLPERARLGTDETGGPQFSFLRYAVTREADASTASTIQQAGGGGILHFLVLYETPQETVDDAQEALRERLGDDEITLRGPVVFEDGRYSLVSSILLPGSEERQRHLLATGRAPVLEGNRIALAFDLEPQQSTILLESFEMATPDISLVFDMTFGGLADAYDAQLVVDWSKVHESRAASAGGSIYFVSADVEAQIDELIRNNSIRLVSRGSDATMEALVAQIYDKILDLLFEEVEPERVPEDQRGDLFDALAALAGPDGPLSSRNTTGFGISAGFQYKHMRSEGESVLDFNHQATVERHHLLAFNIGDLYQRYGEDRRYFRDFAVDDPTFQQRAVHVAVDGALLPEFDRLINSVTVTLRKRHAQGAETVRELVIDRELFRRDDGPSAEDLTLVYGWNQDSDRLRWLEYEHRALWSFKGGGEYRADWSSSDAAMIDLYVPYERRTVQLVDAGAPWAELGVRAVVVQISYPFFGRPRREQMVVRTDRPLEDPSVEITLPLGEYEYDYDITWMFEDGRRVSAGGRDGSGLVFLDEPPAAAGEADSPSSGGSDKRR
jgi:hypothetical protein